MMKIKDFLSRCKKALQRADVWEKVAYTIIIIVFATIAIISLRFLWGILPIFIVIAIVVGADRWEEWMLSKITSTPMYYDFEADIETVKECMHEAVCNTATILGLQMPLSARSIESVGYPSADGIPRIWFRIKKKENVVHSNNEKTVKDVLEDELAQIFLLNHYRFLSEADGLFIDTCKEKAYYYELAVIPINRNTRAYIAQKVKAMELQDTRRGESFQMPEPVLKYNETATPFYQKDAWEQYGRKIPVEIDLDVYPHLAVVGSTGSGKTTAIKEMTATLLAAYSDPKAKLAVADYKGQDYAFLEGCSRYYNHENYGVAVITCMKVLEARIEGKRQSKTRILLILDEWNNFLSSLPKKEQEKYINALSFCLNMGRSYGIHIIVAAQTAHVDFFGKSRDSLGCVVALGQTSKVTSQMLFAPYTDEPIIPQPRGCGYILLDGKSLQTIVVPFARDTHELETIMIERCS